MISLPTLRRFFIPAIAALALTVVGCASDSDRSRVQGVVSYKGEAVDDGGIAFIPEAGNASAFRATGEIRDGRYDLDYKRGPFPGKYKVEIYWNKKTGRQFTSPSGASRDERSQAIPAKYNEKTELMVEVKPGSNTNDFNLAD